MADQECAHCVCGEPTCNGGVSGGRAARDGSSIPDPLSGLILQMYRAAREQPITEFQDCALGLVRSVIAFDSCRWALGEIEENQAVTRLVHLQNEPDQLVSDWDSLSHQDTFKDLLIANPGRAFSVHTPTFLAGPERAGVREYTQRYRHANVLGAMTRAPSPRHWNTLSLFRAESEQHYAEDERSQFQLLMPHLIEAHEHNRAQGLRNGGLDAGNESAATAIAFADGKLCHASSAFFELLRLEWHDWNGHRLPAALSTCLTRPGCEEFIGGAISVTVSALGASMFLRARRLDPLRRLSPREALVARLYGEGLGYKEIARQLDISPTTTRAFLQRIYAKLQVSDKAQLAALLNRQ